MWHVHRVVAKLYKTATATVTNFEYWKHAYGITDFNTL